MSLIDKCKLKYSLNWWLLNKTCRVESKPKSVHRARWLLSPTRCTMLNQWTITRSSNEGVALADVWTSSLTTHEAIWNYVAQTMIRVYCMQSCWNAEMSEQVRVKLTYITESNTQFLRGLRLQANAMSFAFEFPRRQPKIVSFFSAGWTKSFTKSLHYLKSAFFICSQQQFLHAYPLIRRGGF